MGVWVVGLWVCGSVVCGCVGMWDTIGTSLFGCHIRKHSFTQVLSGY